MSVFLAESMRLVWGTVGEVERSPNSHGKLSNSRLTGRNAPKRARTSRGAQRQATGRRERSPSLSLVPLGSRGVTGEQRGALARAVSA